MIKSFIYILNKIGDNRLPLSTPLLIFIIQSSFEKKEKWPKEPKELEPKIYKDFSELIKEINELKIEVNDKFKIKKQKKHYQNMNQPTKKLGK